MKICGISDIHGNLIENIPECDVLCICGDVVTLNAQRNIEASKHWWETKFIKWVDKLPCKKVIIIPGNHDFYLEYKYKLNEWGSFKDNMQILSKGKLVFLIDEMIGIARVHYDYDPILNALLTNGEHNFVELFFIRPLFRFITDESRYTLNRFQFCRLITGRCLDTTEHDTALSHSVDYIRLSSLEIFSRSVKVYLFHHFGDDRHTGRNHRIAGIENLMHNLLNFPHFKS